MVENTKITISKKLKKKLDWQNVNKTMSYDYQIWALIDRSNACLDWSFKHPKEAEELSKIFRKNRRARLGKAFARKIPKKK